jgi:Spirocyclase AveC-like
MSTQLVGRRRADMPEPPLAWLDGRRWLLVAFGLFGALMLLMLVTAETGAGALANPTVAPDATSYVLNGVSYPIHHYNGGLRANEPLLGWTGWAYLWQAIGFGGGAATLGYYGYRSWRSRSMHPMLAVSFAAGGMFAFDPFYNWLGYFPTNPAFLHIPHGALPWSDLAPTFEPVFFFPLYIVWLVIPALIAHGLWKRLQARGFAKRGPAAFMSRHPLIALIIVCKCGTFPLDLGGFRMGCVTEAFIFTQAPGPLIAGGTTGQAQWLWEPLLFELTMMGTCLLLYHGRDGLTFTERWAPRLRSFRRFPYVTQFAVAWVAIGVTYVACLVGMGALRFTGQVDRIGSPWPYVDTIAYDPDKLYQRELCLPAEATREGSANWNGIRPEPSADAPCLR